MALCPKCKTEQTKRTNNRCPNCLARIDIYKKAWFLAGDGSPPMQVIEMFETFVSTKLTHQRYDNTTVAYRINRKGAGFKRELVAASRLLEIVDNDISLIKETLSIMFSKKLYTSMIFIEHDFNVWLAVAKANRESAKQTYITTNKTINTILDKEDLFK